MRRNIRGGFEACRRVAPTATFCSDAHLTRVGFVSREEVGAFVEGLGEKGLIFIDGGECVDIAHLAALLGTDSMQPVYLPPGWDPAVAKLNKRIDKDGSETQTFDAVPRLWEKREQ